ncbi:MAG: CDGSH iron-sulfur domain-containing protein [Bacteroidales bacterium]|nr:MAG: CDGSH iron-sulfur domain-containing protein [Bacteroidales bacterium]
MEEVKRVSAEIQLSRNQPIKISGNFNVVGIDGNILNTDFNKEVYLCACGKSKIKPFCDGSHKG